MYHLALRRHDLERRGTADVGDGARVTAASLAQPVVADGRVFAMDAVDVVSAFDASNRQPAVALRSQARGRRDHDAMAAASPYRRHASTSPPAMARSSGARRRDRQGDLAPEIAGAPAWRADGDGRPRLRRSRSRTSSTCWRPTTAIAVDAITACRSPRTFSARPARRSQGDIVVVPYSSGELFALARRERPARYGPTISPRRSRCGALALARRHPRPAGDRPRPRLRREPQRPAWWRSICAPATASGNRISAARTRPGSPAIMSMCSATTTTLVCMTRQGRPGRAGSRSLPRYEDEEKKKTDPLDRSAARGRPAHRRCVERRGALGLALYRRAAGPTEFPDGVFVNRGRRQDALCPDRRRPT